MMSKTMLMILLVLSMISKMMLMILLVIRINIRVIKISILKTHSLMLLMELTKVPGLNTRNRIITELRSMFR